MDYGEYKSPYGDNGDSLYHFNIKVSGHSQNSEQIQEILKYIDEMHNIYRVSEFRLVLSALRSQVELLREAQKHDCSINTQEAISEIYQKLHLPY